MSLQAQIDIMKRDQVQEINKLQKQIDHLQEQQQKDSLMLLRTVLDAVEELMNKGEGGTV